MNGKGSKRRKMRISQKQFEKNWKRIFLENDTVVKQEDIYKLMEMVSKEPIEDMQEH